MRIDVSTFGASLLSRPVGREAALALQANALRGVPPSELIELDFSKVLVLTPSWADEFVRGLEEALGKERIKIIEGDNASVKLTFETLNAA